MTYYDILGVPQAASTEEIRKAYRKLAQEFHPDKLAGIPPAVAKLAEEKFKDVQEAYEILTKHRAEYDNQLRAMGSIPPPPQSPQPKAHAAAQSAPRPGAPPAPRPVPKRKNIWYFCGKVCSELPWHAWALIGVILVFVVAATITPSGTPESPKQTSTTAIQSSSTPAAAQSGPTFAEQQKTADNKAVTPALIEPSAKLTEQFGGIVHNQSANASAEFWIVVQDAGGILSGCMGVKQPLFGSGPLSGRTAGADVSFVVTSAIGKITFVGRKRVDTISGTYRVEHESSPTELGTFTLGKVKSNGPASDFDKQNCPTDAEVHQQRTTNNSVTSNPIPTPAPTKLRETFSGNVVPPTGSVVVHYADDWEKVKSSCSLLTGRGPASDLSHVQMMCGDISSNYSDWTLAPHFTARIVLDDAAMQTYNSKTRSAVPLFCEDKLEANGDLHCTGEVKKQAKLTPEEFKLNQPISREAATPKPIPKYIALGRISCYANQRIVLYTDETLAKTFRQLSPGESVYKVGTMGDSIGLTFKGYYASNNTEPDYWLDGKEIRKLTCDK